MSNSGRHGHVHVNGRDLHFVDEGKGTPMVLLHGWGFDHTCWRPLVDRLATQYRVITVDLPGHGRSRPSASAYTMEDLAADIAELITTLDLREPPIVVGHSLGGAVVQQLAVSDPQAVRAIIVLDSDLNTGPKRFVMSASTVVFAWWMRLAARLLGVKRSLGLYGPLLEIATYSRTWRKAHPKLVQEAGLKFVDNNLDDLIWSIVAWATRPDLTNQIAKFTRPALLIRGSKDLMTTGGTMRTLSEAIPYSRLQSIAGAGHATIVEQPDAVAAMIRSFVEGTMSDDEATVVSPQFVSV